MTDRFRNFRKPDGSWNLTTMFLVAVIVTCAVYIIWSDRFDYERPMDALGAEQLNK